MRKRKHSHIRKTMMSEYVRLMNKAIKKNPFIKDETKIENSYFYKGMSKLGYTINK